MTDELNLKELKNCFLDGYREAVNNRFIYQLQSNPESFPFYQEKNWKINLITLPNFFDENYIVLISDNEDLEDYQKIDLSSRLDLEKLQKNHTDLTNDSKSYVENHLSYVNKKIDTYFIDTYKYTSFINEDVFKMRGGRLAQEHYSSFNKLATEKMSSKTHEQVSPFNHLNLDDMKRVVNDDTFSYQIDQGLECYKHELYLPAAATFAVAIETLLIKLKRVNGIKHKDSDSTMYDKLLDKLKERNAINYRTKVRIEVAYKMRNIVNHTQAGTVAKNDCDFLLNTLRDAIDDNQEMLKNAE